MATCLIDITDINEDDCLGNSRAVLNRNFQNLKTATCALGKDIDEIIERLCSLVPYEGILNYWGDITLGGASFDATGKGLNNTALNRNLTGYALCNGKNGTPDLRDRFVVAAGGNYQQLELGPIFNSTASLQFSSVQLTIPELPIHDHGNYDPTHIHDIIDNGHEHMYYDKYSNSKSAALATAIFGFANGWKTMLQPNGPAKTKRTSKELANINLETAKSNLTIDNEGGDRRHENRPPYFALAYIMRYR